MRCAKCGQPLWSPFRRCPHCGFRGDPELVFSLLHVRWLLEEIEGWTALAPAERERLRADYHARQQELEGRLGLRPLPFSQEEARIAWPELWQRQALLRALDDWAGAGLLRPVAHQAAVDEIRPQVQRLLGRLEGHLPPADPQTGPARLAALDFLLEAVERLGRNRGFVSPAAQEKARDGLLAEKQALEVGLGLVPAALEPAPEPAQAEAAEVPQPQAAPPPPPLPWRERLWRTLLSERTLQVMLFLGIFLLFSAAISFVIWGWQSFSAPLRVAIPTAFTAAFLGLGWLVRHRTRLYRSGIALTAIAALLIPVDSYTLYANYYLPPEQGPAFWLLTSLVCLVAYVAIALATRSGLFGYLAGTAGGSAVLAMVSLAHQAWGISLDWRMAALSVLAAGLVALAEALDRPHRERPWEVLVDPLRGLGLLAAGVLMLLSLGLRYTGRTGYDTLHDAMTVCWWLGGFVVAWGAVHHRSRSLGLAAALALPVAAYMAQVALFVRGGVNPAWHALGLALLVPLYLGGGRALLGRRDDPVLHGHGRTATAVGVALLVFAALWSLTDLQSGAAAAASHAVLAGSVALAACLWRRPAVLYAASFFSLASSTFAMSEIGLSCTHLCVGWATLAIGHVLVALGLGRATAQRAGLAHGLAGSLVVGGFAIAGVSLLGPLLPYDGPYLAYALGNGLGLAVWAARLAHSGQPGFASRGPYGRLPFQWLAALGLPAWVWLLWANHGPLDARLPLTLGALAWGLVALSWRLARVRRPYRWPCYLSGLATSVAAVAAAFAIAPRGQVVAVSLLSAGLLYLTDALANRQPLELAPGGLVVAWGLTLLLERLWVRFDAVSLALSGLVAAYILAGLAAERRRRLGRGFLRPLYVAGHLVAVYVLCRVYSGPGNHLLFDVDWTDGMRLWGAGSQLLLGLVYALYAWAAYREHWAHAAAWLVAGGGGFLAVAYSAGRGSLAAKVAVGSLAYVLAERGLNALRRRPGLARRRRALARLAWRLFGRALLLAGWVGSAAAVVVALVRNLILLGGGRSHQTWAVVALFLVVGLYALAAWLFRRPLLAWLATLLSFAPWTILAHLGWYVARQPLPPEFAISWLALAWVLYLVGLGLVAVARRAYAVPPRVVAQLLIPCALLWGAAHIDTSRITFGLAVAFYALAAALEHRRLRRPGQTPGRPAWGARFLYPALGLVPVWGVYLLAWLAPAAPHEHYGLLMLAFAAPMLALGRGLLRLAPRGELAAAYALPAYLTGYVSLLVGTLLVAHDQPLLAAVLFYDALFFAASARLFRHPLWAYPAAVSLSLSVLLAVDYVGVPGDRQGWWLIGLGGLYLLVAWLLRRRRLDPYATAALTVGFALVALGLPPSSQDRTGALWGYGAAAVFYGGSAVWLGQPLLFASACALAAVPYGVGVDMAVRPEYHGLALFPGALAALAAAWWLDRRLGPWPAFPWGQVARWPLALAGQLVGWWSLPLYGLGLGLAAASPFFTASRAGLAALNWLLTALVFAWAACRFRLRGWLVAAAVAVHLGAVSWLQELGWWRYPAEAWAQFLPLTVLTAAAALVIERARGEGSPLRLGRLPGAGERPGPDLRGLRAAPGLAGPALGPALGPCLAGWSRPLYALVLVDLVAAQLGSLGGTSAGALVSLSHALMVGVLATFWCARRLPYLSAGLGVLALGQWLSSRGLAVPGWPVPLAELALAYGLAGYALALALAREQRWLERARRPGLLVRRARQAVASLGLWERPLQRFSSWFSIGVLALTAWLGPDLARWTVRALLGLPFRDLTELATVERVVGVLSFVGLLYVAAAYTRRRLRLGYLAVGMLLAAWTLYAFYVQRWDGAAHVQWYALPAGLYLLGIAWQEWERGNRTLGRALDYAAVLLMMGSLFWQTLLFGWRYALMLGGEGFGSLWWGSARRLRRFLYAGMLGVVLATTAQLINSLRSVNQWIVFGIIGLLVVVAAIVVERKLEDIKALRQVLESWE